MKSIVMSAVTMFVLVCTLALVMGQEVAADEIDDLLELLNRVGALHDAG